MFPEITLRLYCFCILLLVRISRCQQFTFELISIKSLSFWSSIDSGIFNEQKSLKYLALKPPKTKQQLPTMAVPCLLRGRGTFPVDWISLSSFVKQSYSIMQLSSRSALTLPEKIQSLLLQTYVECPHRFNSLWLGIYSSHFKSQSFPESRGRRDKRCISPRNSQLSLHPPIMQKSDPTSALLANRLLIGFDPCGYSLIHFSLVRSKAQVSLRSRFEIPSPPNTTRQLWKSSET